VVGPPEARPTTPEFAVRLYARAWERRDSVGIAAILDPAYVGTSTDATSGSFQVASFLRETEIEIVRNMARDPEIVGIRVDLPENMIRTSDRADPAGWATIRLVGGSVRVDADTATWVAQWDSMEFKLRPTSPAPGSRTDTLWSVVRWTESRSR
jgi:hypothetical protein